MRDREAQLIQRLARRIPSLAGAGSGSLWREVTLGIGDDAAVVRAPRGARWVVSCDFSLEGVHFLDGIHPVESVGYKALARAASDLAAMGARGRYFLLGLALPASKTDQWLDQFARGMAKAARRLEHEPLQLIGGDLSRSEKVLISITVIGEVSGEALSRSGARPGDRIYVSGRLGAAQLGLELVRRGMWKQLRLRRYVQPHFYPEIPTRLGQLLSRAAGITAMMDISDGLSTDLARLCAASGVGAQIQAAKIPCARMPDGFSGDGERGFDPLELALNGGDDYSLLFTARATAERNLAKISRQHRITCIGEVTRARGVVLVSRDGSRAPLEPRGWEPFRPVGSRGKRW